MSLILEILYRYTSIRQKGPHDPPQKIYPNLTITSKHKFYESEVKLNRLNLLKKLYYGIPDKWEGSKSPPPGQIGLSLERVCGFQT